MKRFLTMGLAALFLAGCGGGGSMSVPSGTNGSTVISPDQKSHVRYPQTLNKTYNYTLTVKPYPPGFNPPCQESNLTLWLLQGTTPNASQPFELAGGQPAEVNVGNCLAATGNSMHALLEIQYGHMRFIPGSGNFKLDSVDDSAATLTVTDNTTGYSTNTLVYLSY